ncbi:MAG: GNAT family N-acetyltransferase, partial [Cellulomonas sp.]
VVELPASWCTEPYLLGEHALATVVSAWGTGTALVAIVDGLGRERGLFGVGSAEDVAEVLASVVPRGALVEHGPRYATIARGGVELLAPEVREALGLGAVGSSWDWMWTDAPLQVPDHARAERLPLGPGTTDEVREFLSRGHPTASTAPDDRRLIGWWGVREGGILHAAVGAIQLAPGMAPHLVSLGVDPGVRGRGLAGQVLAAAVEDCLEVRPLYGPPAVSLGLYADNDVARRVYLRLGLQLRHGFTSRRLDGPSSA